MPTAIARAIVGPLDEAIVDPLDRPEPAAGPRPRRRPHSGRAGPSADGHGVEAGVPASYTVAAGDSVSSIAEAFGISTARVLALNGLSWSSMIFPGQVLALADVPASAVPPAIAEIDHYTLRPGDTICTVAKAHGLAVDDLLTANGLSRASIVYPGQTIALPHP